MLKYILKVFAGAGFLQVCVQATRAHFVELGFLAIRLTSLLSMSDKFRLNDVKD